MAELIEKYEPHRIMGACFVVYKVMPCGSLLPFSFYSCVSCVPWLIPMR
jgi:hypothetical protein